jgi:glucose-6-phosphate isomerase
MHPSSNAVQSPAALSLEPLSGVLANATGRYEKRLRDLDGVFADAAAFSAARDSEPDRLVYEVYEHRTEERTGELIFGTSVLHPGRIGREYHLTRGHLHRLADRSEIYHCVQGHGVMLMETLDGESQAIELRPGRIAYVPGHWIHRSVNVGDEPFVTVFCYPADAGQDYDVIAAAGGMRELVVVADDEPGWRTEPNPSYGRRHG